MRRVLLTLFSVILLFSCNTGVKKADNINQVSRCYNPQTSDSAWYFAMNKAPVFAGLDGIDFKISSKNEEVQMYFNQGLMLAYGFNHAEAARSFFEATRLDSTCAMAFWGYAYVLGPNYNGGMEEGNYQRAFEAVMRAKDLSKNATPLEARLIEALVQRYAEKPPSDRTLLNEAYARAMQNVYNEYPLHADVGALYADALMNLHPWDLYDRETKKPKEWTPALVDLLEVLMEKHPNHPGAHHFYIHAMEASNTPEKALFSANILDTLVRGSGHLLHMPSHIYINTGDYHLGTLSNLRAVQVDSIYTSSCHAQGSYPLAYYPHNYHFLAATAALEGNSNLSWEAAFQLQKHTATSIMDQDGWGTLQHYYTIPYYIGVKFGMWDKILSLPRPEKNLVYIDAIWHYSRGMAFLGKNDMLNAQKELDTLRVLAQDKSLHNLTIWDINTTFDLVQIATKVLSAGVAVKVNDMKLAISLLNEAVAIEDLLNYNEPPDWFFSIRHHLGALLLHTGKYSEAEKVYRQDLRIWKKNGWSLIGLHHALIGQNKLAEAQHSKDDFDKAWQYADVKITSSSNLLN